MAQMAKNPPANAEVSGDVSSLPKWGKWHGGGNGNPLQYFCLENPTEEPGRLQSIGLQRVGYN